MSIYFLPQPTYVVVDVLAEADTKWHDGTKVYVKSTDTLYVLDSGTFVLIGTGSVTTDHAGLSNLTYAAAGHTGFQASLGFTAENVANKDTDGALAANSDTKYASQKATKTYTDTTQAGASAAADEVWKTASHATLPDNVLMIGV